MNATYTFDVFSTLDGFGAHAGDRGGYWGKQGPELLDHRLALYRQPQLMVFGATTYQSHARMLAAGEEVAELKTTSAVPLRSHGSLSLDRALMAEGLVDFLDGHTQELTYRPSIHA